MRITFLALSFALFLVACDGGGASGPVDSSSSAVESSETVSSVAESSSSALLSSSEEISSSEAEPVSSSSSEILSSSEQSSSSKEFYISYGTMTDDRDGQVYKTVTIEGEIFDAIMNRTGQMITIPKTTWMLENLRYPYLQPTAELDSSSLCFEKDSVNCAKYGRLYLWSAAMDSAALFSEEGKGCGYFAAEEDWQVCSVKKEVSVRGVCPEGWRLPTYEEDFQFTELRLHNTDFAYIDKKPESIGFYNFARGRFMYVESDLFWLSTEKEAGVAYYDEYDESIMFYEFGTTLYDVIGKDDKRNAYPVRCVKSESE